jgi:hypothetical protein
MAFLTVDFPVDLIQQQTGNLMVKGFRCPGGMAVNARPAWFEAFEFPAVTVFTRQVLVKSAKYKPRLPGMIEWRLYIAAVAMCTIIFRIVARAAPVMQLQVLFLSLTLIMAADTALFPVTVAALKSEETYMFIMIKSHDLTVLIAGFVNQPARFFDLWMNSAGAFRFG